MSYCLVIYYQTKKSRSAGILTVIRYRVGDICILLSIGWIRIIGDFNFLAWSFWSEPMQSRLIIYLIIFSATTKWAQVPFSAWLPAAIAAPTPVSALVHSSTLVLTLKIIIIFIISIYVLPISFEEYWSAAPHPVKINKQKFIHRVILNK